MSEHPFADTLERRFGGVLLHGKHDADGQACALEAASVARGAGWSDDPALAGLPDLRPINDGLWPDDATRTRHMLPVIVALWDWPAWDEARRKAWSARVAERTIREVLPIALRAVGRDAEAERCEREGTREAAYAAVAAAYAAYAANAAAAAAAYAAYAANAAAANAAYAANAANDAAYAANAAANAAAAAEPLVIACRIWAEEAAA